MKRNNDIIISTLSYATAFMISVFTSVALYFYAYTSLFSRFILDDFCMGQTLVERGFWSAQTWWYMNFIGRYSFTFFIHMFVGLGPRGARFMPTLFLLILMLSIFFTTYINVYKITNRAKAIIASILSASSLSFFILFLAPEVSESFDWVVGMTTYFMPIVFFSLSLMVFSFLINTSFTKTLRKVLIIVLSALVIISGGFSESFTVVMCAFWLIMALSYYLYTPKTRKEGLKLSSLALLISILSLIIVTIAPGNAVRKSYFPKPQSPTVVAVKSVNETVIFVTSSMLNTKTAFLLVFISATVVSVLIGRKMKADKASLRFIQLSFVVALLIFCSFFPPLYALSNLPPERVLIIPMFILIMYIFVAGYLFGSYLCTLQRKHMVTVLLVVMVISVFSIIKVPNNIRVVLQENIPNKAAFANGFDSLDKDIRYKVMNGEEYYIAELIPFTNNHEATQISDPTHWINKCIAGYYKLKTFQYYPL